MKVAKLPREICYTIAPNIPAWQTILRVVFERIPTWLGVSIGSHSFWTTAYQVLSPKYTNLGVSRTARHPRE